MERKTVGVLINILGSVAINLGNNLQSSGHRSRQLDDNTQNASKYRFSTEKAHENIDEETGYLVDSEEENDILVSLLDCSGGLDESPRKMNQTNNTFQQNKAKTIEKNSSILLKSRIVCDAWLIGTCFFFLGTVAVFISYSFAPQSLLAPLGSVQFVTNIFFARFIHQAPITRRMLISTSIILMGLLLVVHFSPDPNPKLAVLDGNNIKELYYYYYYQVYLYTLTCIALVAHVTYQYYNRAFRKRTPLPLDPLIRPLCYALLSAVIGTQSTLQAKCLSELLIHGEASPAFTQLFTYITFGGFLLTTAFWLYRLNRALALFEPLFIIPVLQVFWTCFATLNGGIFFREFFGSVFLAQKIEGFVTGIAIIFFGVYLLAPKQENEIKNHMPSPKLNHFKKRLENRLNTENDISRTSSSHEVELTILNQPSTNELVAEIDRSLVDLDQNLEQQTPHLGQERLHSQSKRANNVLLTTKPVVDDDETSKFLPSHFLRVSSSNVSTPSTNYPSLTSLNPSQQPNASSLLPPVNSEQLSHETSLSNQRDWDDDYDDDDTDELLDVRARTVSELLDEAQSLLFGDEDELSDPLELTFIPTLHGILPPPSPDN